MPGLITWLPQPPLARGIYVWKRCDCEILCAHRFARTKAMPFAVPKGFRLVRISWARLREGLGGLERSVG